MGTESAQIKQIGDKLSGQSWLATEQLFPAALLSRLSNEARMHEASRALDFASTGRNHTSMRSALRGDSTLWLDDPRCEAAAAEFLAALDALRKQLNQTLMLGLESVEAHFAVYPAGAAYVRHRDRFRDDDARVLSLVCYLNENWPEDAGGELRLHLPAGPRDIAPRLGTCVLFMSGEIEHEVLPASQTRYSIAAWFRQREIQLR